MLTEVQKAQLTESALNDCEKQVSMAGFIYKKIEARDGPETAEEAIQFYLKVQRNWMQSYELDADEAEYQRSVEM